MEVIGGEEKYMAVCRECHKLDSPVKRSPFKQTNGCHENSNGAGKRNLFGNSDMETTS